MFNRHHIYELAVVLGSISFVWPATAHACLAGAESFHENIVGFLFIGGFLLIGGVLAPLALAAAIGISFRVGGNGARVPGLGATLVLILCFALVSVLVGYYSNILWGVACTIVLVIGMFIAFNLQKRA